jgi:hypothetical protein
VLLRNGGLVAYAVDAASNGTLMTRVGLLPLRFLLFR